MIRPIITVPNKILNTPCRPVEDFGAELVELVEDMFETMYDGDGIGLAAPQVGVALNVFVMDVRKGKKPRNPIAFINPEMLCSTLQTYIDEEGCLSIPGVYLPVARNTRVGFRSRGLKGESIRGELRALEARCFQHELDHLRGVLFTSKAVGAF